jgi:hypothetical protein
MGGGHGFFTNRHGLGVDNVVEVEIVLPTGEIVTANEHSYPDLFWAIRGGGGGTFGILTKVTMKAHPGESLHAIRLSINPGAATGKDGFVQAMAYMMSIMPDWNDWGLTGHPILQNSRFNSLFTAPGKEAKAITEFVNPFAEKLRSYGVTVAVSNIDSVINALAISQNMALNAGISGLGRNSPGVMGSRLLSREGLKDVAGMERMMKTLMEKDYICEPFNVGGGAVARNKALDIAINPSWRNAIVHFSILPYGQRNFTTVQEVQDSYQQTQKDTIELLDPFSVNSAVYLNEVSVVVL